MVGPAAGRALQTRRSGAKTGGSRLSPHGHVSSPGILRRGDVATFFRQW